MVNRFSTISALALALLAVPLPAQTPAKPNAEFRPPEWPTALPAQPISDLPAAWAMADAFPQSGAMLRRVIALAVEAGDTDALTKALQRYVALGGGLSDAAQRRIAPLLGDTAWPAFAARLSANMQPLGISHVEAEISSRFPLIEDYSLDCTGEMAAPLFATSVVGRALLRSNDGAENWKAVTLRKDTGSLFGMARGVDLYIASAVVPQTPNPEGGFSGLVRYQIESGKAEYYPAPPGATPDDVALGTRGAVYVSDGMNGAVYRWRPGMTTLEVVLPAGRLRSAQGMAEFEGGLYVADYGRGIARIDLKSGKVTQMLTETPIMLDGVDGMTFLGSSLLVMRAGTTPRSILQLTLSDDGQRITHVREWERPQIADGEPTLIDSCFPSSDIAFYVADAQWDRFADGPTPKAGTATRATTVRLIELYDPVTSPTAK